jgi:glutathione synthase/RimK-type ligase-like ATP-grasp enzyme
MSLDRLRVAVGINENNWHVRFMDAVASHGQTGQLPRFEAVRIDEHDWLEQLEGFDALVWKPKNMGFESAAYFKEKVYFLEKYMAKLVVPNFDSVWHFESKVAQSYLLQKYGIPVPRTFVSFDHADAAAFARSCELPIVAKHSEGAGSANVWLFDSRAKVQAYVDDVFFKTLVKKDLQEKGKVMGRLSRHYLKSKSDLASRMPNQPAVYFQEFIAKNPRDLRITVIGDRYAYGFWRNNRENDFRASGSGNIDYQSPVPESAIRQCLRISRELNFDSMAYDLLFVGDEIRVVEMSYGYVDKAIHGAPGYYCADGDRLRFVTGNTWPQALWLEWTIQRLQGVAERIGA